MLLKGIVIDPFKAKIEYDCTFDNERIEGMYYKVYRLNSKEHQLIPVAYVYPIENRVYVEDLLAELRAGKKAFDELQAKIYYKELPRYR